MMNHFFFSNQMPPGKRKSDDLRPDKSWSSRIRRWVPRLLAGLILLASAASLRASKKDAKAKDSLAQYVARVRADAPVPLPTLGSCWVDSGRLASLSSDYKAAIVGDLITIVVAHNLTSSNTADVATARTYTASSGINSLPGRIKVGGVSSLLGLQSAETLAGKGQGDSSSSLTTTLAGRVVAVLPGGNLVVEAERVIDMNNEKQTVTLRGLVRRGDIGPNNTVVSTAMGDLELEIKGKGVISNGVRPPNVVVRTLMRIFNF
jgi:flagellar L-ring protein FlgH